MPTPSPWPCLSLRQPWAHLVVRGGKDVENRSWSTDYRGPLYIHASRWEPPPGLLQQIAARYHCALPPLARLLRGGVVGQVVLLDCVRRRPRSMWADSDSEWYWVLGAAEPLVFWPCRGQAALFYPFKKG